MESRSVRMRELSAPSAKCKNAPGMGEAAVKTCDLQDRFYPIGIGSGPVREGIGA